MAEPTGAGSSSDKGGANLGLIATVGGVATVVALVVQVARPLRRAAVTGGRAFARRHVVDQAVLGRPAPRGQHRARRARSARWRWRPGALLILNGGAQVGRPAPGELVVWG